MSFLSLSFLHLGICISLLTLLVDFQLLNVGSFLFIFYFLRPLRTAQPILYTGADTATELQMQMLNANAKSSWELLQRDPWHKVSNCVSMAVNVTGHDFRLQVQFGNTADHIPKCRTDKSS
jgi:hypothetical protein